MHLYPLARLQAPASIKATVHFLNIAVRWPEGKRLHPLSVVVRSEMAREVRGCISNQYTQDK